MRRVLIVAFEGAQTLDVTGPAESVASGVARARAAVVPDRLRVDPGGGEQRARPDDCGFEMRTLNLLAHRSGSAHRHGDRRGGGEGRDRRCARRRAPRSPGSRAHEPVRVRRIGLGLLGRVHPGVGRAPRRQARGDPLDGVRPARAFVPPCHRRPERDLRRRRQPLDVGRRHHRHRHGAGDARAGSRARARGSRGGAAGAVRAAPRLSVAVQRRAGGAVRRLRPAGPGDHLGAAPPGRGRRRDAGASRGSVGAHAAPPLPRVAGHHASEAGRQKLRVQARAHASSSALPAKRAGGAVRVRQRRMHAARSSASWSTWARASTARCTRRGRQRRRAPAAFPRRRRRGRSGFPDGHAHAHGAASGEGASRGYRAACCSTAR